MQDVRQTKIGCAGIFKLFIIRRNYITKVLSFSLCFFLFLTLPEKSSAECIKKDNKLDQKTVELLQSLMVDYGFRSTTGPKYIDVYKLIPSAPNKKKFLIVDLRGCDLNCSAYLVDLPQKKVLETIMSINSGRDICVTQSPVDKSIYIDGDLYKVCEPAKPYGDKFFTSESNCESNKK